MTVVVQGRIYKSESNESMNQAQSQQKKDNCVRNYLGKEPDPAAHIGRCEVLRTLVLWLTNADYLPKFTIDLFPYSPNQSAGFISFPALPKFIDSVIRQTQTYYRLFMTDETTRDAHTCPVLLESPEIIPSVLSRLARYEF